MAELIRQSEEFELLGDPDTNIVVYRFIPAQWRMPETRRALSAVDESAINKFNADLQRAQSEAGRGMVSRTTLFPNSAPVVALRAVLGNPLTSHEDLRFILEDQLKVAAEMAGG
jgi:glutamate decarboxylase